MRRTEAAEVLLDLQAQVDAEAARQGDVAANALDGEPVEIFGYDFDPPRVPEQECTVEMEEELERRMRR